MGMVIPTFQRRVAEQDMPSVRVQNTAGADSFGAGIGAGLEKLGAGMEIRQKNLDIRQDKIDTAALLTAENTMQTQTTNFLYKDLLQRKGSAAATADKDFEDYWKTTIPEARKGLSPKAQVAFDNRIADYKNQIVPKVNAHAVEQNEVALQDSYDGAVYSSALSFSQPGAYLDTAAADRMRLDLHQKAAATMVGRDPNAINAKASAAYNQAMVSSLKSLHDQGDVEGASKWLELYGNKVNPALTSPYVGWIKEKTIDIDIDKAAESIVAQAGNDYAVGKSLVKGATHNTKTTVFNNGADIIKAGEQQLGLQYKLGAEGVDATDCGKYTQQTFSKIGVKLEHRTADGQYYELEQKGKTFTDDQELKTGDLVFFNVKSNQERWKPSDDVSAVNSDSEAYKGITHVGIYSGDGKVLQAGSRGVGYADINSFDTIVGYGHAAEASQSQSSAALYSEEDQIKLQKAVDLKISSNLTKEHSRQSEALQDLQDQLAGVKDPQVYVDTVKAATNVRPAIKQVLIDGEIARANAAAKRTASDPGARVQLEKLSYNNTLTQKDVDNLAPMLTSEHYVHYSIEAAKVGSGQVDKESKAADRKWDAFMDAEGQYTGDSKKNNQQKAEIIDRLDSENLKGYARYDRAVELVAREKKNNNQVIHFTQNNNMERTQLVSSYGEKIVDLTEQGLKRSGDFKGAYGNVSLLLSNIGDQAKSDTRAQEALDLLVRTNTIINEQTWSDAYQTVARE